MSTAPASLEIRFRNVERLLVAHERAIHTLEDRACFVFIVKDHNIKKQIVKLRDQWRTLDQEREQRADGAEDVAVEDKRYSLPRSSVDWTPKFQQTVVRLRQISVSNQSMRHLKTTASGMAMHAADFANVRAIVRERLCNRHIVWHGVPVEVSFKND